MSKVVCRALVVTGGGVFECGSPDFVLRKDGLWHCAVCGAVRPEAGGRVASRKG